MPALCIIPQRALADEALTPSELRVLLSIGSHADRAGAGVWASARTISAEARVSRATVFRCLATLEERGYIRRTARYVERRQTSSMYQVMLDETGGSHSSETGEGLTALRRTGVSQLCDPNDTSKNDTRKNGSNRAAAIAARQWTDVLIGVYPKRPEPYSVEAVMRSVKKLLVAGVTAERLVRAAEGYARKVAREQTDPQYVRGLVRFLHDGVWEQFDMKTVGGRTREEWARSGQDVAEFDRLAQ